MSSIDKCEIMSAIFKYSGDGIMLVDTNGIIQLWNSGCEKIFGYSANEAINKSLDTIIPDNMRERHWDGFHKAIKKGKVNHVDYALAVAAQRKNKSLVPIEFKMNKIEKDGKIIGIFAIVRNVEESIKTPF